MEITTIISVCKQASTVLFWKQVSNVTQEYINYVSKTERVVRFLVLWPYMFVQPELALLNYEIGLFFDIFVCICNSIETESLGENTLEAQLTRLLVRSITELRGFSVEDFLNRYISFMQVCI